MTFQRQKNYTIIIIRKVCDDDDDDEEVDDPKMKGRIIFFYEVPVKTLDMVSCSIFYRLIQYV